MSSSNFSRQVYSKENKLKNIQQLLVCPSCKSQLKFFNDLISCKSCDFQVRQISNDWFNLLGDRLLNKEETQWEERQQQMEDWYKNLVASPTAASDCLTNDYAPFASYLATLSGAILDIGGGVGVVRHYLGDNTDYIVLDPSLDWLGIEWTSLIDRFPCLETKPCFVRGVGEYLPFASQTFDAVLSFWSLNHASNPKQVFHEAARVLRPGGKFLVVLEDMIPQWHDFIDPEFPASQVFESFFDPEKVSNGKYSRFKLFFRYLRGQWPLQSDHIRIREADILDWTRQDFQVLRRVWMNQFLTFELKKLGEI